MAEQNQWHAYVADDLNDILTDPDEINALLVNDDGRGTISIRRRTALPDKHGHLPGTWATLDIFGEVDLMDVEPDEAAEVWQLTQAATQGLNQAGDIERLRAELECKTKALQRVCQGANPGIERIREIAEHALALEVWDASVPPGGWVCAICRTPVESEPCTEHSGRTTDVGGSPADSNTPVPAVVAGTEAGRG